MLSHFHSGGDVCLQVAHLLLDLHQSKKKSATDQFILQRRAQASHDTTTRPSSQPQDDTSKKEIQEKSSPSDSTSDTSNDTDSERTHSGKGTKAPRLPPAPAASDDNQAFADWNALFDRHNEVACLMLGTMSPKLYQQFENKSPQEMITELQKMYRKPSGVELQELVNMFHSCKQAEGQSVSDHVLLMKSYLDQLATLNYAFPDKVSISFILNSLSSEFQAYVQNYNMQSMEKTISEVHSLLIEFKKSIKRNKQQIVSASSTPHVMAILSGRVQKNKPQGKTKGKEKGKGLKNSYPTKPKKPQPYKKERLEKDGQCHHCKEEGHWKRNRPLYLAELMKKKKTRGQNVASTSFGIYTIELFAFPKNS
ncbi:zinc finger, CCHC-type containing protein [Tanacetum coccineum]